MFNKDSKDLQSQLEDKSYFLNEIAAMTKTGSYSGNMLTGEGFLDDIAREILEIPHDYVSTLNNSLRFFSRKSKAVDLFENCMKGIAFEEEVQMCRYDGTTFWAKATGKPYISESGKIIGIRGVFTNIDGFVQNTINAQKHAKIITAQNERLVHFAHIVSHNLRSHASNFQLTLETFDDVNDQSDHVVFQNYLKEISFNLNRTLKHLNEVVIVHTQRKTQEIVDVEACFKTVLKKYNNKLQKIDANVIYDFAEIMSIEYVPSFFESILDHLMSNAIKYRSPVRSLEITVKTILKKGKKIMIFEDNGSGIDMNKNGDKIFQMYRTFHDQKDSLGVGLFLIKNQVESLGGDIKVKSHLNEGTRFSIRF